MKNENTTVNLSILGKEYKVACPRDKETDLLSAARQLDDRMRVIRNSGRTTGSDRIAVIAALNMSAELAQVQQELKVLKDQSRDQLDRIMEKVTNETAESTDLAKST